jgi:hypothetical protein
MARSDPFISRSIIEVKKIKIITIISIEGNIYFLSTARFDLTSPLLCGDRAHLHYPVARFDLPSPPRHRTSPLILSSVMHHSTDPLSVD